MDQSGFPDVLQTGYGWGDYLAIMKNEGIVDEFARNHDVVIFGNGIVPESDIASSVNPDHAIAFDGKVGLFISESACKG